VAAKQLRFAGHPFQVLLADEDYLKWLTTLSNAFLADLQSRYPVFMAALSEALDKIAAPKSAPVKQTTNLVALKRQAKKATVRKASVESPGKVAAKPARSNQTTTHPASAETATEPTYLERIRACQLDQAELHRPSQSYLIPGFVAPSRIERLRRVA
jgi:hypothetical protein